MVDYSEYDFPEMMEKFHNKIKETLNVDELVHLVLCDITEDEPNLEIEEKLDTLDELINSEIADTMDDLGLDEVDFVSTEPKEEDFEPEGD